MNKKTKYVVTTAIMLFLSAILFSCSDQQAQTNQPSGTAAFMSNAPASDSALHIVKENSPEFYALLSKDNGNSGAAMAIDILETSYLRSIEKNNLNSAAVFAMNMAGLYKKLSNIEAFTTCIDEALRLRPDYPEFIKFRDRVLNQ